MYKWIKNCTSLQCVSASGLNCTQNTCLPDTVNCSIDVPSSNTESLKYTEHSRCSNAVLFDPVNCFDRQNVNLNCSHLSSSNLECLTLIEPCICIKYIHCFQNTSFIKKFYIQSANTDLCNDNLTLSVNTDNVCWKMVSTADFNISFDTDSCTSVDKHTFTKYLTSDSLIETCPSSETCCAVEGSRIDSCDYSCITCQRVSDNCNCSINTVKSVTRESLTFDKTVDVVESSDLSINSSVLPESLTSAYIIVLTMFKSQVQTPWNMYPVQRMLTLGYYIKSFILFISIFTMYFQS